MSQRKLLLPPFHGQAVRRYVDVMAAAAGAEVERWPEGKPFALRPRMQAITLEVILRAVFGVRDPERMELFHRRIPPLGELSSALDWLPFMQRDLGGLTPAARFRKALAAVDELIYAEIEQRRATAGAEERDDVLSLLLAARHEDGSAMSDIELRDELVTLLTAGHETTATGLSWAFERLLRTPRGDGAAARLAGRRRGRRRRRQGDAARAAGRGRRGPQAHPRDRAGRLAPAGGDARPAGHRGYPHAARPLSRAGRVPARALPRQRRASRMPGFPSAAGCGAASAPRSRRWR